MKHNWVYMNDACLDGWLHICAACGCRNWSGCHGPNDDYVGGCPGEVPANKNAIRARATLVAALELEKKHPDRDPPPLACRMRWIPTFWRGRKAGPKLGDPYHREIGKEVRYLLEEAVLQAIDAQAEHHRLGIDTTQGPHHFIPVDLQVFIAGLKDKLEALKDGGWGHHTANVGQGARSDRL